MKSLILIGSLVLSVVVTEVFSIQCASCYNNSKKGGKCENDPTHKDVMVDCPKGVDTCQKTTVNYDSDRDPKALHYTLSRGCASGSVSGFTEGCDVKTVLGQVTEFCICKGDKCNGSAKMAASFVSIALITAVRYIM